MAPVLAASG